MVSEAQRTLVKSPPELWTEVSELTSLARHLDEFGEIRITRSVPEKRVEWEGEQISGTIALAPSGWGTKVTLTATRELPESAVEAIPEPEPVPEPEAIPKPDPAAVPAATAEPDLIAARTAIVEPDPEPIAEPFPTAERELEAQPETESRRGFFARLFRRRRQTPPLEPREPDPETEPESIVEPQPVALVEPEPIVAPIPEPEPRPEPEPDLAAELAAAEALITDQTTAVLTAVLDRLGAAHHRPFSRA